MLRTAFFRLAMVVAVTATTLGAYASSEPVGTTFTYQGRLTQAGEPASGTVDLTFRLYAVENGGSPLPGGVLVANNFAIGDDGHLTIDLNFGGLFTGAARWLEIQVNDQVLSPRQPIMAAPYAMVATTAANVPSKAVVGNFGGITGVGTLDSLIVSGNTGIGGQPDPWARLKIETPPGDGMAGLHIVSNNTTIPHWGLVTEISAPNSIGIEGRNLASSGGGQGVYGLSTGSPDGIGVHGYSAHASGETRGGWFRVNSPNGFAVYSTGPAGSRNYFQQRVGIGVLDPEYPLHVSGRIFASSTSWVIRGHRTQATGTFPAVWGQTESASSGTAGVRGDANHTSPGASAAGVYGLSFSTTSNGIGVRGRHEGSGVGVLGESIGGTGVRGVSSSASGYGGVFGDQSGPGRGILVNTQAHMLDRVGIGSTNPNSMLQVNGAAGINPMRVQNSGVTRLLVHDNGNVMVGSATTPQDTLHVAGTTRTNVLRIMGGSDLAERFDVADLEDLTPQPGMVVCLDPANPGKLVPSTRAYDGTVAGIISGANGINSGMIMGQEGSEADGAHPVALTGRVYVYADATSGAIEVGDLLTTADTPGHAMRVNDYSRAQGAIIGKAMTPLAAGETGMVLVLVSLQ